jgi:hypothetical protein
LGAGPITRGVSFAKIPQETKGIDGNFEVEYGTGIKARGERVPVSGFRFFDFFPGQRITGHGHPGGG